MKVICISGKAGAGKDLFASILREHLEHSHNRKVLIIHYADLLKFVCQKFFGWNGEKNKSGRTLLQYVGTDVVRAKDENFWVDFLVKMLTFFEDQWDVVLIPDARFPNEIERMKALKYVSHVRVVRDNRKALTEEQESHASETALDHYPCDLVVENNGSVQDLVQFVEFSEELHWIAECVPRQMTGR